MTIPQYVQNIIKGYFGDLSSLSQEKIYNKISKGIFKIQVKELIASNYDDFIIRYKNNIILEEGIYYIKDEIIVNIIEELNKAKKTKIIQFDRNKDLVIEKYNEKNEIVLDYSIDKNVVDSILSKHPDITFVYNPSLKITELDLNITRLQVILAQVSSGQTDLSYPTQFVYRCSNPACNCFEHTRFMYEVISSEFKSTCPNLLSNDDGKMKMCGKLLKPVIEISNHKNIYFQTINTFYEGRYHSLNSISLVPLTPGNYNLAVIVIHDKQPQLFIVGVEDTSSYNIKLPEKIFEKHYIKSIRETIDKFIFDKLDLKVTEYDVMKEMFIIQRLAQLLFERNDFNVAMIGDKGVGKTFVAKMYMPVLSNNILFTNIKSISVPSMRGTEKQITLLNKALKLPTVGQLGSYDIIYIDELLEDTEKDGLLEFLKPFLLESDYGNFKTNGDDVLKKKTAQLIISGNIKKIHKMSYRKKVKENFDRLIITNNQKNTVSAIYDDKRDLFQNLSDYNDDTILKKAIMNTRDQFRMTEINWIDGTLLPAIDRFQIAIYMKGDDHYSDEKIIRDITNAVKKNKSYLDVCKKLKNDLIEQIYKKIKQKIGEKKDEYEILTKSEIELIRDEMKKIVNKYELNTSPRFTTTFTSICVVLKLVNNETTISKETFEVIDKYYSLLGRMIKPDELKHNYVNKKNDKYEKDEITGGSETELDSVVFNL